RSGLGQQGRLDGVGERSAMLLCKLDSAARVRVLIAAAAGQEQRDRTGVGGLQVPLRAARIIAEDLIEILAESRVVAGVSKEHRSQLPIRAVDAQDWNGMV